MQRAQEEIKRQFEALRSGFVWQQETDQQRADRWLQALQKDPELNLSVATPDHRTPYRLRISNTQICELNNQAREAHQAASDRDRLFWVYEDLEQCGDERFSRREHIYDVVRQLPVGPNIGLQPLNMAMYHVTTCLNGGQTKVNCHSLTGML